MFSRVNTVNTDVDIVLKKCSSNPNICDQYGRYPDKNSLFLKKILKGKITSEERSRLMLLSEYLSINVMDLLDIRYLRKICPNSGECLTFGTEEKMLASFFQQYDISKVNINSVRQIGYPTLQGFVLELQLKRQISDLVYDSYVVLKTSVSNKSDNLYYEYRVGQYLNSLLHRFPCFVKTHGIYKYSGNDNLTLIESTKTHNFETANQIFKRLQPATIEDSIHSNLGLVIQRVHNSISFADLLESYENSENKPAIKHEIICILYQLYFVLAAVPSFTHGDLHIDNLILTPANIGKKFRFHYADVVFECSYVAKVIDVARSCFKGSVAFKEELDAIETDEIQREHGYDWNLPLLVPCDQFDLMLMTECINLGIIELDFITINKDPVSILQHEDCESFKQAAYIQLQKKNKPAALLYKRTKNVPTIHNVCPYLKPIINQTLSSNVECIITVSKTEPMNVYWVVSAGTRKYRRKKQLSAN